MTEPTRDELKCRLAGAQVAEEHAVRCLIVAELDECMVGIRADCDQAEAALEEAVEALVDPLAQLAVIEEKITAAERKSSDLRQRIDQLADDDDDDDAPDRLAAARMHLAEWEARVTRLRSKRDFAESGFQPLFEARTRTETWVKALNGAKREFAKGMVDPFGPFGQQTEAYKTYRMPQLFPLLLLRDRESREWDKAMEELEFLVDRLGYKLMFDAEKAAQAMRSEMADAAASELAPAPSAGDIMAMDVAGIVNAALQNSPSRIDDHRNTPPVPRNAPVRDYMQLPGRGAR